MSNRIVKGRKLGLVGVSVWVGIWFGFSALASPNYLARIWQVEQGLPQDMVTAVVQTRDGYIWVGTFNGIARFDGVRFVCFDTANTPELADNIVSSLFEGDDGALWIGHATGALTCYTSADGFKPVVIKAKWPKKKIERIAADESGDIWLLNEDGLLARMRDGLLLAPEVGREPGVVEMARSGDGQIWVGRDGRVSALHQGRLIPLNFDDGHTNTAVSGIGVSRDGGLWMQVDWRVRKWRNQQWVEDRCADPVQGAPFLKLIESRDGTLAAGTSDHGLVLISPNGVATELNRASGFSSDWVVALYQDREGNFLVGTGGGGLVIVRESCVRTVSPPDAWQGRVVLSMLADHGNMWVGTEGAGLYRYEKGTWTNFAVAAGIGNPYVWSLAGDTNDNLWIGTWSGGLYLRKGGEFLRVPGQENSAAPVTALCASRGGGIWVGTGNGLLHYDCTLKMFTSVVESNPASPRLDVRCILETRTGDVWFGTEGEGLFRVHAGAQQKFQKADGLPGDFVQCLHEDQAGNLWIGTFDGLCRFDSHGFSSISTKQGLPNNVICDIEDDGHGYFWVSSYNGIFRVSKSELQQCADGQLATVRCLSLGVGDGLPALQSSSCGSRTEEGKLLFGATRGLVEIDPQAVKTNQLAPPVLIENLLVDGQALALAHDNSRLRISPGRHRIKIQFTGLSFVAPEKVRFKHKLQDLDADWTSEGTARAVDYDYLPPGNYVFHVTACNNDSVWSPADSSLAFVVLPFFWQTDWFRALTWVMFSGIVAVLIWLDARRRMHRKLERLERQQAISEERARIAHDIHDDLGQHLTRITMLSGTALGPSVDTVRTRTGLQEIYDAAREVTRAMDEIVWAVNPRHDTLESLVNYLEKCVLDFLGTAGIRYRLEIPGDLPEWTLTSEVRHNLFLALKEALNNIVKHSHATEARIEVTLRDSMIVLLALDNGRGFPVNAQDRPHEGNGLENMRQRLAKIGGCCEITSEAGKGTKVAFKLSVKHLFA